MRVEWGCWAVWACHLPALVRAVSLSVGCAERVRDVGGVRQAFRPSWERVHMCLRRICGPCTLWEVSKVCVCAAWSPHTVCV